MYVIVHHIITDAPRFWDTAAQAIPNVPDHLKLHHTITAKNGAIATCLWESASIQEVQEFLEPALGSVSRNTYEEAENRDGIAMPSGVKLSEPMSAR
jgi:hypothetical protein